MLPGRAGRDIEVMSMDRSGPRSPLARLLPALVALLLPLGAATPTTAQPARSGAPAAQATAEKIVIAIGQSRVVSTPWPAARVSVTDPAVADVEVLTPGQVL